MWIWIQYNAQSCTIHILYDVIMKWKKTPIFSLIYEWRKPEKIDEESAKEQRNKKRKR